MSNTVITAVKEDLEQAGLQQNNKCPNCGNTELHAVFTTITRCNMQKETSDTVNQDGILLDVYCSRCNWHLEGHDDYSVDKKND